MKRSYCIVFLTTRGISFHLNEIYLCFRFDRINVKIQAKNTKTIIVYGRCQKLLTSWKAWMRFWFENVGKCWKMLENVENISPFKLML